MKQIFMLLLALAVLTGCGVVNNLGVIGKNLTRMATTHPYKVEEGKEAEILASGMGIVDLDVLETGTAWIRMDESGVIEDKNYTLTYHELGSRGRRQSQLPPGTYILNGAVNEGMTSGYYLRSIKMENFGWDEEKGQPRCFSFTLKAGELLYIPTLIAGISVDKDNICPPLSFENKSEVPVDAPYQIGNESK